MVGAEVVGDLGNGPVALGARGEDELVALGAGVGLVAAAGVGQEEGRAGVAEEGGAEVAQRAGGIAEALGGLGEGGLVEEEGAQGLVAAMVGVGGMAEIAPGLIHIHAAMITTYPRHVPHGVGAQEGVAGPVMHFGGAQKSGGTGILAGRGWRPDLRITEWR